MEALKADKPYLFRPYTEQDIPFIQSSWASSYYKGANYIDFLTPEEFNASHRPMRECFFMRPAATAIVCVAKEDTNTILGWVAVEKPVESEGTIIHYVYVKGAFKEQGIGTELIQAAILDKNAPVIFTHKTDRASKIMQKKRITNSFKNFYFFPHLI